MRRLPALFTKPAPSRLQGVAGLWLVPIYSLVTEVWTICSQSLHESATIFRLRVRCPNNYTITPLFDTQIKNQQELRRVLVCWQSCICPYYSFGINCSGSRAQDQLEMRYKRRTVFMVRIQNIFASKWWISDCCM